MTRTTQQVTHRQAKFIEYLIFILCNTLSLNAYVPRYLPRIPPKLDPRITITVLIETLYSDVKDKSPISSTSIIDLDSIGDAQCVHLLIVVHIS